jgi:hypothetical protein
LSALQLPGASASRVAACWYSTTQVGFDFTINDGQSHRVSIYFYDGSSSGRQERVDLVDRTTGTTLDSRTVSGFSSGAYLTWEISGNVSVRVTPSNVNAVASGIFFDGVPSTTVTTTAQFVKTDSTTRGNWNGVYGGEGYSIAGVTATLPSYASFATAAPQWVWASTSTNPSALVVPATSSRIAACWYSSTQVGFDLSLNDSQTHRVSVYFLDATSSGRQERVDVVDRATGAVLDSRTVSNFATGTYMTWDLGGDVSIRLTPTAVNAVASGIFFDVAP